MGGVRRGDIGLAERRSPPAEVLRPTTDLYHLLCALVDHVDELEAELTATRHRLETLRAALARLTDDEYQPTGAQHVAAVIERHLAQLLGDEPREATE